MTGRNFATAEEARGGINVPINQTTQRRVGVRKRTATCWELRRWDAAKKGYVSLGHFKSQQEAEAAQADQAAPKTPRTKHTKGTAPSLPFAPFPRMTLTVLLCALHFLLPRLGSTRSSRRRAPSTRPSAATPRSSTCRGWPSTSRRRERSRGSSATASASNPSRHPLSHFSTCTAAAAARSKLPRRGRPPRA